MENFVLAAYTTVGFNMDDEYDTNGLCDGILLVAFNTLNSSTISDSSQHALECFHDEEQMRESMLIAKVERDNVFWQRVHMGLNDTTAKQQHHHPGCNGRISLCQLVNMSSKLCDLIYEDMLMCPMN